MFLTPKQRQFNRACYYGDIKTAKALINDPDVDPSDRDNWPIRWAAERGYKEVVELLMQDPRVDPSDYDNEAIRDAAYHGHKDIVELLMQDPRVDPSYSENSAIRLASRRGHKEIVELLLTDKRVMGKIEYAFEWCNYWGGYELLKACVDERERVLEREKRKKEKQRRIQEAIEEMSADCELYF